MFFLLLLLIQIFNTFGLPVEKRKCKYDTHIEKTLKTTKQLSRDVYQSLLVDIKFSVFHKDNNGKTTRQVLDDQIDVLNKAFSGKYSTESIIDTNIRFRIKSVQYINNADYYKNCDSHEWKIVNTYSSDNKNTVNIMICNSPFYLGWAYYPWSFKETHKFNVIFIHTESLPNGKETLYNKGFTGVHEIGHFFGLRHTFSESNNCDVGDGISDTPAEKSPSYECNKDRDTCPNHPGKDPINNYMDYSPDECLNEFTYLQVTKMWDMIDKYKPKLKQISLNNNIDLMKSKYELDYKKKGNGLCIFNNKKLYTIRYKLNDKYVTKEQCIKKAMNDLSQAITFTFKKMAKNKKYKYNCLIHRIKNINKIENIKSSTTINSKQYENSYCLILKMIEKNN
jgi:predicted Zn-dependent protease